MAITFVQKVSGAGATLVLNNIVAGNALFMPDGYFRGVTTGLAEAVPTDTNGVFVASKADVPVLVGSIGEVGVGTYHQQNAAAGTHTVTPEGNTAHETALAEFSGMATSGILDQVVGNERRDAVGTNLASGNTPATTQADELAISAFVWGTSGAGTNPIGIVDPIANYTTLHITQDGISGLPVHHSYRILAAIGAQSVTENWTDNEVASEKISIATFKAPAAATQIPYQPWLQRGPFMAS